MISEARMQFQSTPSSQRETYVRSLMRSNANISIHSLFAEGDSLPLRLPGSDTNFNPLPLRRGRQHAMNMDYNAGLFQSTPSSQRETTLRNNRSSIIIFQSTPSSQRETEQCLQCRIPSAISIHSLFAEGDRRYEGSDKDTGISIHSLFAEGDYISNMSAPPSFYFNPLPLRRGRPTNKPIHNLIFIFQSTPSSQRETAKTHKNTSCPLTYYTQNPQ